MVSSKQQVAVTVSTMQGTTMLLTGPDTAAGHNLHYPFLLASAFEDNREYA